MNGGRRRIVRIAGLLGAAAVAISGCSRDEPPASRSTATITATATRTATATSTQTATAASTPDMATTPSTPTTPVETPSAEATVTTTATQTPSAPPTVTVGRAPTAPAPAAPDVPVSRSGMPLVPDDEPPPTEAPRLCDDRSGGALITFAICDQTLTVWSTVGPFIDEAIVLMEEGERRIPGFGVLVDGTDCDDQWTWFPAPNGMEFAEEFIRACDGCPADIENDKEHWFTEIRQYCPRSAQVVAVDDRR